jgi:putative endonuclease
VLTTTTLLVGRCVVSVRGQALGNYGERIAADRLVAAGMTILDRNWRCSEGEIDIVARDGDVLVVCEVKTRRGTAFGGALEAITPVKAQRLRRLAACWLRAHDVHPLEIRIDAIGVMRPARGPAQVDHLRGAV